MKTGTDSAVKTWVAIVLGIVALFMVGRWLIGSNQAATPHAAYAKKGGHINSLDPTLQTNLLRDSEQTKYESKGRNIFVAQADIPKPVQTPITKAPETIIQGPPPPPPINVKFFGYANRPGEPKKIFLSRGDDIWVAKEGDVIDRRYKIVKINPSSVEIEDVLNNNRQSIPLNQS